MRRSSLTTSLYLLLVFLSGAVVGIMGHSYATHSVSANSAPRNPEQYKRKYIDEMRTRLKLNDDQVSRLSGILDETRRRFHEQHERAKPEMDRIQNDQVSKVSALLNDTQRSEYEKMRMEREKRRAQEHRRKD